MSGWDMNKAKISKDTKIKTLNFWAKDFKKKFKINYMTRKFVHQGNRSNDIIIS